MYNVLPAREEVTREGLVQNVKAIPEYSCSWHFISKRALNVLGSSPTPALKSEWQAENSQASDQTSLTTHYSGLVSYWTSQTLRFLISIIGMIIIPIS